MTEEKNPQKPRAGIFLFLGKRKKQRRAFHIPTAPAAAATLSQNPTPKGAFLHHRLGSSPGSFFDWKRLLKGSIVVPNYNCAVSAARIESGGRPARILKLSCWMTARRMQTVDYWRVHG